MRQGQAGPGRFVQCSNCRKTLFSADFEQDLKVCRFCGHHHRLTFRERIAWTFDEGSFEEEDTGFRTVDVLHFPDYMPKHEQAAAKTGLDDSVVTGRAKLAGMSVSAGVAEFGFMGGSMGAVAGEKVARCLERGADERTPVVVFCASGGARMQEGLVSLMQMAKTTAAVERCRAAGVPFIAVMTDPTMAGVLASYASIADVILAEPKAMIGFAGARVSKQAQVVKAPADFQTAEWAHKCGMVDRVVERRDMRSTLATLVRALGAHLRSGKALVGA
jgi:acetyl-CoA carboxylase carboxyl transferase subunit beta